MNMNKEIRSFIEKNEGLTNTELSRRLSTEFDKGRSTIFKMISKCVVEGELFKSEDGKIYASEPKAIKISGAIEPKSVIEKIENAKKPVVKKGEDKPEAKKEEVKESPKDKEDTTPEFKKADIEDAEKLNYKGKVLEMVIEGCASPTTSVRQREIADKNKMKILRKATAEEAKEILAKKFGTSKVRTRVIQAALANEGILSRSIDVCDYFKADRVFHGIFKFTRRG